MSDIEMRVKKILSKELAIDIDSITNESSIKEDLGSDSLTMVEIVIDVEDEFHIEVPDEEAEGIVTVQDIIDAVTVKLSK
jgi:acyl carrier protein